MIFTELAWHTQIGYPILTLLQVLPLLAVPVMLLLRNRNALTGSGFLFALAEFLLAVDLYRHYDHDNNAFQFAERLNLLGPLNYHAAVDGISILFILLTTLLALLVILYGRIRNYSALSQYFVILFVVESSLVSMFVTVDLLWFVLLYALQLLPIGLLVWRWATSVEKDKALLRFLQFMSTGFLLLLCGTIMLGRQHVAAGDGNWTFDLFELVRNPIPGTYDSIIFFLLFYGMAIRVPLFPLHGWLPRVAEHGSIAVAPVFLLGLKIGIYGILRFIFPLLPEAVMHWHVYVVTFAVTGVFYAALLAMLQDNLRRLLAYAVVSHTSILVIGLFSLNHLAIQGSMFLSVNFGLAIAGLLFMTGLVFMRTRTTLLPQLGGLFDRIPIIGATFFVAGLAI
ncbi:MAG: NADH-quinone oxidoreductase subunit M, partial [Gammaproteobacteria bacterium]|nr:NADH-quinone oxidoreductase subunit M [Gammaproteobacteria bacterium]